MIIITLFRNSQINRPIFEEKKTCQCPGADPGRGRIQGGATGAPTPKIGKKYDFSHEIPQKCSRLLRSAQFF
jgi:hypothetical protein